MDTHFDASTKETFENIVGKGEIASNKQFLHFPQCCLLNQIIVSPCVHIFDIISLVAFELEESKIGISGKVVLDPLGFSWECPGARSLQLLVLVKPQKDMNNVRCRRDITEILLKWRKKNHPTNHQLKERGLQHMKGWRGDIDTRNQNLGIFSSALF